MSPPVPFKIAVPEEKLRRLRQKLLLTEWPDEVPLKEPRSRGAPLQEVKGLVDHWLHSFDWRAVESRLNELPQFTTDIEVDGFGTYNVHFIHQKSSVPNAIPLIFLHGWPGSFIEVTKILPELVQGGRDFPAFHVVAPSLIDYGFSQGNLKEGFGLAQHAEAYHKLMQSLGYSEYVSQGGDIGNFLTRFLALQYPGSCKAQHTNMPTPNAPDANNPKHAEVIAAIEAAGGLSDKDQKRLAMTQEHQASGMGYAIEHMTRPQTIGYSLADSPVGQLAWIYEKLVDWTAGYAWTADEVLTWVSIYRFSRAGPDAPQRIYYEMVHLDANSSTPTPVTELAAQYIDVPLGTSRFQKDVLSLPKVWDATMGPVVFQAEHDVGGHFAAWECPRELVSDLRRMFAREGPLYGCVDGQTGFQAG
ncbi:hypothetical protein A1O3_00983 [Capronia epimyces CBS 606.96]|uniref:Epoxide hydrolase N-terminal domain-containing protein n=1 Tax=Capronia epimyces CBS 606.96 TaxID=1182542 RepID=W9YHT5_9EURO|nr:uncharacterized protein A1O3_00983 [Capronia epimyces CBS 606.96]EXJ92432.1 hypothetical protein A1O3_00983 [Capronia epimyces CBS 606.96]